MPSEEGKQAADAGQQHAKDIREAQQKELYQRTGDILYPPSGAAYNPCKATLMLDNLDGCPHVSCSLVTVSIYS